MSTALDFAPALTDISAPNTPAALALVAEHERVQWQKVPPCAICRMGFTQADADGNDAPTPYVAYVGAPSLLAHRMCILAAQVTARHTIDLSSYVTEVLAEHYFTTADAAVAFMASYLAERFARALSRHERIHLEVETATQWNRSRIVALPPIAVVRTYDQCDGCGYMAFDPKPCVDCLKVDHTDVYGANCRTHCATCGEYVCNDHATEHARGCVSDEAPVALVAPGGR